MKVRVTVRFRGREITYPELALEDLKEIAEELADIAVIEQAPIMEGKVMTMVLTPRQAVQETPKARQPKPRQELEAKPVLSRKLLECGL